MTTRQSLNWDVGAIVAAMLAAQSASAAVQTVTWNASGQGQASLPWFDARLGRLTAVTAEATYTSLLPLSTSYAPADFDSGASGLATLANINFALSGTASLRQKPGYWTFGVTETGSATWTDPATLARFYGTSGTLGGYAGTSVMVPGSAVSGNYVPTVSYKISYTYDDAPAVPEPATWAMMAGGFALLGVALRLARRHRSAPAEDVAKA